MRHLSSVAIGVFCCACGLTVVGTVESDRGQDTEAGTADAEAGSLEDATVIDSESDGATTDATGTDAAPTVQFRLNINGPSHHGVDYPGQWVASPVPGGSCGPSSYSATTPLSNTNDAPLFEGEAYGNPLVCSVGSDLPAGTYRVVLYFAEIFWGPNCPGGGAGFGSRVFDVLLEGTQVLTDFDVYAAAGGCIASTAVETAGTPVVRSFEIEITDGTLDIEMPASTNNAKLSALELSGPL